MTTRRSSLFAAALVCATLPAFAGDDVGSKADGAKDPPATATKTEKAAGITWFATWDQALAEANRTNRPILFTSAAPACGSVPGMW